MELTRKIALIISFSYVLTSHAVQTVNSCRALYEADTSLVSYKAKVYNLVSRPFEMLIKSEDQTHSIPSDSPFLIGTSSNYRVRESTVKLGQLVLNRGADRQAELDTKLTEKLGKDFGMGFKDKTGRPFDVKVNGIPIVIEKSQLDDVVKGMQPTLFKMREILQIFMSNPDAPASAYPLKHTSKDDIEYIIKEMKNSPYYEPLAVSRKLRKYPFGSVFGVDATFGKLDEHPSHIFEINAGTPSGLSNLTLIFESLRRTDPEMFKVVSEGMRKNEAFIKLRQTMEDNGKQMIEDGIAVELGTGIFNGAHPDIAMISHFSGMPLVERSDMFIDRDGYVRIKRKMPIGADGYYALGGKRVKHIGSKEYKGYVQISSIYSRAEEGNALQENTTATSNGIGIKIPSNAEINSKLSKSIGVELLPGVAYKYVRNEKGEAINVEREASGKPMVEPSWDQFATDPVHADNQGNSLLKSIHAGRIYFSPLATRLIDHKGILSIVTREVQAIAREQGLDPNKTIVSPPKELRGAQEMQEFYKMPRNYVVKVPDESGGVGVAILPTATNQVVTDTVNNVRRDISRYVVQSRADFMSLIGVSSVSGKNEFVNRANDGRIFIYMDGEGKTHSDDWAILMRVADYLKLSTNTSQGAQYGAIKVNSGETKENFKLDTPTFPKSRLTLLTSSQSFYLKDYLISVDMIADGSWSKANNGRNGFLQAFWNSARHSMATLGPEFSYMIRVIEQAQKNEISNRELTDIVRELRKSLRSPGLDPLIRWEIEHHDKSVQMGMAL